jgi:hypothetical protein
MNSPMGSQRWLPTDLTLGETPPLKAGRALAFSCRPFMLMPGLPAGANAAARRALVLLIVTPQECLSACGRSNARHIDHSERTVGTTGQRESPRGELRLV